MTWTANGQAISMAKIVIGASGPWFADVTIDSIAPLVGRVTLELGGLTMIGTADPDRSGHTLGARSVRVVAGAGGWSDLVGPKAYHNDAGVKALNVATDAARAAGETLGAFAPESLRVGVDYARQAGPAARALEDVIGSALWWVDYAGVTQVGARATNTPAEADYDVQGYEPGSKLVTLAAKSAGTVTIGSILSRGLDEPQTVRDLELELSDGGLRIRAWCSSSAPQNRIAGLLQRIIDRATDGKLFGAYRYRVVRMSSDRVELQAIRKAAGLPDLVPLSMLPGVPGAHGALAPGSEVLVQFVEGDRSMPFVTHFAGKDGKGFAPISLLLEVTTFLDLGGEGGSAVALAALVQAEVNTAITGHTHAVPALGTSGNGVLIDPVGPVGATKVRAL